MQILSCYLKQTLISALVMLISHKQQVQRGWEAENSDLFAYGAIGVFSEQREFTWKGGRNSAL